MATDFECPKCRHRFAPDPFSVGTPVKLKDTGGAWNGVIVPADTRYVGPQERAVEFNNAPAESDYAPGQRWVVPVRWLERV